jgi:hypothetical protein
VISLDPYQTNRDLNQVHHGLSMSIATTNYLELYKIVCLTYTHNGVSPLWFILNHQNNHIVDVSSSDILCYGSGKHDNARSISKREHDDFILVWALYRVITLRIALLCYGVVLANEFNAPDRLRAVTFIV